MEQEGLGRHLKAVATSIGIGVIPYARDGTSYTADLLEKLSEECPNVVALKDGLGDVASLQEIVLRLSGRMLVIGGMPTAELSAVPYRGLGITSYSSAVYNFVPVLAMRFFRALNSDPADVRRLLERFYIPLAKLRSRRRGYAVSVVKAGLRVCGFDCGPVRPPLVDFTAEECDALRKLVEDNA
jgi:5-dehydro-4-deoxyglucarate dehydratase